MKNRLLLFLLLATLFNASCTKSEHIPEIEWKANGYSDEALNPIRHVFDIDGDNEYFSKETTDGAIVEFLFNYGSFSQIYVKYPVNENEQLQSNLIIQYDENLRVKTITMREVSLGDHSQKEKVLFFNEMHCLRGYETLIDNKSQIKFTFELFDFDHAFLLLGKSNSTSIDIRDSNGTAWLKKELIGLDSLKILFSKDLYVEDIQVLDCETGMRCWESVLRMPRFFEVTFSHNFPAMSVGWVNVNEKVDEKTGQWYYFNQWFLLVSVETWYEGELMKTLSLD